MAERIADRIAAFDAAMTRRATTTTIITVIPPPVLAQRIADARARPGREELE
jgi:hypothetical protein